MSSRRFAGVIRLDVGNGEHTTWPDPCSQQVVDAAHRARYNMDALSQTDCYHLASCAETMNWILGQDYSFKWVVENLRRLRKAVRLVECEPGATPKGTVDK